MKLAPHLHYKPPPANADPLPGSIPAPMPMPSPNPENMSRFAARGSPRNLSPDPAMQRGHKTFTIMDQGGPIPTQYAHQDTSMSAPSSQRASPRGRQGGQRSPSPSPRHHLSPAQTERRGSGRQVNHEHSLYKHQYRSTSPSPFRLKQGPPSAAFLGGPLPTLEKNPVLESLEARPQSSQRVDTQNAEGSAEDAADRAVSSSTYMPDLSKVYPSRKPQSVQVPTRPKDGHVLITPPQPFPGQLGILGGGRSLPPATGPAAGQTPQRDPFREAPLVSTPATAAGRGSDDIKAMVQSRVEQHLTALASIGAKVHCPHCMDRYRPPTEAAPTPAVPSTAPAAHPSAEAESKGTSTSTSTSPLREAPPSGGSARRGRPGQGKLLLKEKVTERGTSTTGTGEGQVVVIKPESTIEYELSQTGGAQAKQTSSLGVQAAPVPWTRYFFPDYSSDQSGTQHNSFVKHFDVQVATGAHSEPGPPSLGEKWTRLYYSKHMTKPPAISSRYPYLQVQVPKLGEKTTGEEEDTWLAYESSAVVQDGAHLLMNTPAAGEARQRMEAFLRFVAQLSARTVDDHIPLNNLRSGCLMYLADALKGFSGILQRNERDWDRHYHDQLAKKMAEAQAKFDSEMAQVAGDGETALRVATLRLQVEREEFLQSEKANREKDEQILNFQDQVETLHREIKRIKAEALGVGEVEDVFVEGKLGSAEQEQQVKVLTQSLSRAVASKTKLQGEMSEVQVQLAEAQEQIAEQKQKYTALEAQRAADKEEFKIEMTRFLEYSSRIRDFHAGTQEAVLKLKRMIKVYKKKFEKEGGDSPHPLRVEINDILVRVDKAVMEAANAMLGMPTLDDGGEDRPPGGAAAGGEAGAEETEEQQQQQLNKKLAKIRKKAAEVDLLIADVQREARDSEELVDVLDGSAVRQEVTEMAKELNRIAGQAMYAQNAVHRLSTAIEAQQDPTKAPKLKASRTSIIENVSTVDDIVLQGRSVPKRMKAIRKHAELLQETTNAKVPGVSKLLDEASTDGSKLEAKVQELLKLPGASKKQTDLIHEFAEMLGQISDPRAVEGKAMTGGGMASFMPVLDDTVKACNTGMELIEQLEDSIGAITDDTPVKTVMVSRQVEVLKAKLHKTAEGYAKSLETMEELDSLLSVGKESLQREMDSIEAFTACNVAHDIRSELTSLMGEIQSELKAMSGGDQDAPNSAVAQLAAHEELRARVPIPDTREEGTRPASSAAASAGGAPQEGEDKEERPPLLLDASRPATGSSHGGPLEALARDGAESGGAGVPAASRTPPARSSALANGLLDGQGAMPPRKPRKSSFAKLNQAPSHEGRAAVGPVGRRRTMMDKMQSKREGSTALMRVKNKASMKKSMKAHLLGSDQLQARRDRLEEKDKPRGRELDTMDQLMAEEMANDNKEMRQAIKQIRKDVRAKDKEITTLRELVADLRDQLDDEKLQSMMLVEELEQGRAQDPFAVPSDHAYAEPVQASDPLTELLGGLNTYSHDFLHDLFSDYTLNMMRGEREDFYAVVHTGSDWIYDTTRQHAAFLKFVKDEKTSDLPEPESHFEVEACNTSSTIVKKGQKIFKTPTNVEEYDKYMECIRTGQPVQFMRDNTEEVPGVVRQNTLTIMAIPSPDDQDAEDDPSEYWGVLVVTSDGLSPEEMEEFGEFVQTMVAGCYLALHTVANHLQAELIQLPRKVMILSEVELKVMKQDETRRGAIIDKFSEQKQKIERYIFRIFSQKPLIFELNKHRGADLPPSMPAFLATIMMLMGEKESFKALVIDERNVMAGLQSYWPDLQAKIASSGGGMKFLEVMEAGNIESIKDTQVWCTRNVLAQFPDVDVREFPVARLLRQWIITVLSIHYLAGTSEEAPVI